MQPPVRSCWAPPIPRWSSCRSPSSRGRAVQTLDPPTTMDSAGSEARAARRCSAPASATESAARSGVSESEEEEDDRLCWVFLIGLHRHQIPSRARRMMSLSDALCGLTLSGSCSSFFRSVQSPGRLRMGATQTDSRVLSRSSIWERPTTPAPQTDAQMGSFGALHLLTMRGTSSTLSVLRRTVRQNRGFRWCVDTSG